MLPRPIVPEVHAGPVKPKCSKKLCVFDGTHRPVLLARPANHPMYAGDPMEITLGVFVCHAHQRTVTVADLLTDEGWAGIVEQIRQRGWEVPERETLGLVWQRVVVKERDPFAVTVE